MTIQTNTATSLADIKAASTNNISIVYDRSLWTWASGDYSGRADDQNIIKSNSTALSSGAWVRQQDASIQPSAAALASAVAIQPAKVSLDAGTFPAAVQVASRQKGVAGKGMLATTVSPSALTGVAVRALYDTGSWDAPSITDLGFSGTGTRQGTGFRFGPDSYVANAEYIGRTSFRRTRWQNLDTAIARPFGNIGLTIEDTVFESANFHINAVANIGSARGGTGDEMHAGTMFLSRNHFAAAEKAAIKVDGKNCNGSSQIIVDQCIGETIPGYTFFITDFPSGLGEFPASRVANFYRENTATSGTITVDDVTAPPVWAYFRNAGHWTFEDTPLGTMKVLSDTSVTSYNSELSGLTALDLSADSTMVHYAARAFTGTTRGIVQSIGRVVNATGLNGPSYRMPVPVARSTYTTHVVAGWTAQTPATWAGSGNARQTVTQTGDPGLPGLYYAQDFTINNGETYLPPAWTMPANKYVVVKYVARLVSGPAVTVRLNGNAGFGGSVTIDNSDYRALTWIVRNTGEAVSNISLYHTATGTSVFRIGGYVLKAFDTAQEALAFANSGTFPSEDRAAYTVTNGTAARTLNADTALTAAAAAYSQTDTQALIDQVAALKRVVATLIQDQRVGRDPR